MACNSKIAGYRAKQSEIWDTEVVECIWGTFDCYEIVVEFVYKVLTNETECQGNWPLVLNLADCQKMEFHLGQTLSGT